MRLSYGKLLLVASVGLGLGVNGMLADFNESKIIQDNFKKEIELKLDVSQMMPYQELCAKREIKRHKEENGITSAVDEVSKKCGIPKKVKI
jgi:hypothetical protein